MLALNCQRPGGHDYCNGKQSQSDNQNGLALKDLWNLLIDHGWCPRKEIDVPSTNVLLDLCIQQSSRSNEQKSNVKNKNMVLASQSVPRLELAYRLRILWIKKSLDPHEEGPLHCQKHILLIFLSAFSKAFIYSIYQGNCA